jgi:predicted DNA-binding transcriptional regulator AlpA
MAVEHHDLDPLLTSKQAAELLGLSPFTLYNKRTLYGQTYIPYLKLNSRDVRYRRSAVLAFIAAREAETARTIRDNAARRVRKAAA